MRGLLQVQVMIDAEDSDLFDALEYIVLARPTTRRVDRADASRPRLVTSLTPQQLDFALARYAATGVEELHMENMPTALQLKYQALQEGMSALGGAEHARDALLEPQRALCLAS